MYNRLICIYNVFKYKEKMVKIKYLYIFYIFNFMGYAI